MDTESFTTPADTLSYRLQTNPENTPNLALALTVPTPDPAHRHGRLRRGP